MEMSRRAKQASALPAASFLPLPPRSPTAPLAPDDRQQLSSSITDKTMCAPRAPPSAAGDIDPFALLSLLPAEAPQLRRQQAVDWCITPDGIIRRDVSERECKPTDLAEWFKEEGQEKWGVDVVTMFLEELEVAADADAE